MRASPSQDPILKRFKAALEAMYGDQIERVILYGSRARGDARDDADYDVAVFVTRFSDWWTEQHRLANLRVDFLDSAGVFIDAKIYPVTAYQDMTPLMHEIRHDGLDV